MLFGDWGTSRLYVLGLCFYATGHAAFWHMLAMSVLLIGIGWAYSIVCRLYPDGGGVYSSARHKSQLLGVIGALLLCADYVVTAALSALDAFHYLDLPEPHLWAAGAIAAIGVLNMFGPTKAGIAAAFVAVLTVIATGAVGLAAAPSLRHARIETPVAGFSVMWMQFTSIILAISGVEAIANMTGIMVEPVEKTSKRAIWPVLVEIVVLNLVLALAMSAMPLEVLGDGDPANARTAHRDDMLRVLASYYISPGFAAVASVVFAALLLSAVNTAVTDLVSIQYMMARDRELPATFTRLNSWGMPAWALVIGTIVPTVTVLMAPDVGQLADLYAIGVVGAVAVNLGTCAASFDLPIAKWERAGIGLLAALMIAIWITIAYEKPHALLFAMSIMTTGLATRWLVKQELLGAVVRRTGAAITAFKEAGTSDDVASNTRFLTATRGNPKLLTIALEQAKSHHAELLVMYVRQIAVPLLGPADHLDPSDDDEASRMFEEVVEQGRRMDVRVRPIYAATDDVANAILATCAANDVERVVLGATRRGNLWRTMKGDVISEVASRLPEKTQLLIVA